MSTLDNAPSRRSEAATQARGPSGAGPALLIGALAGPIFVGLVLLQMAIVPWFDITRYPLSVLSIGESSLLQKAAFVLAGAFIAVGAGGLRRVLRGSPAGRFGPPFVGAFGLGLILSGLFDVDPAEGAPPGSAPVAPTDYTWHMYAHNLSSMLAFVCLSIACFVFVRRFVLDRRAGWAAASALVGFATFILFFLPVGTPSLRLAIATLFMFLWTTGLFISTRARIGASDAHHPRQHAAHHVDSTSGEASWS